MKITEIHRTANGAWSPASHNTAMFAVGTSAHQVDSTFSTTASLEIFEFNPATKEKEEILRRGFSSIEQRIFKLVWSPHVSVQGQTTNAGALVAGVEGGIVIYSVDSVLEGKDDVVIRQIQSHSGAVKALNVSTLLPNFLASGAGESEVFFWDLNVAGHSAPVGPKSYPLDDVSSVAWNKKIGYILASSFANRCVLWDLRKNDAIIKLQDQNSRIRYKSVDWNPEIATQLALASDDDHSPVVQIWDLRNASSPVKTLEGHTRGILSLAWCPHDSGILLSAGKDGCVYGWNVQEDAQPEVIFSLPPSKGWPFEVSWCPRIPSVFALSSYDNSVGIYTVMGGHDIVQTTASSPSKLSESFPGVDNSAFSDHTKVSGLTESIRKAPKWLRRPGAFSFSLDGKIVKTATENGIFGLELGLVSMDGRLVERAGILEQYLNYNQPLELCENKIQTASDVDDKNEWKFIKTFFEEDQHQALKNVFGFDQDQQNRKASDATIDYRNGGSASHSSDSAHKEGGVGPFKIQKGSGVEAAITHSLLLGNIEAAVEMCLTHGLSSEALFLSLSGCGPALPELYHKVREQYFASHGSALSSLIYGIVKTDAKFIIDNCDVANWREVAILFANHFPYDHFKLLTGQLGDKLEAEKSSDAIFCHILSGNIEKSVNLWTTRLSRDTQDVEKRIEDAVEKVFVLCIGVHGNRSFEFGPNAIRLISAYAAQLAGQGGVAVALRLLSRFPSNGLAPWKQILYSSLGPSLAAREANIRQAPMPQFGKSSPVRPVERKKSFPQGSLGGGYNNGPANLPSTIDNRNSLGARTSFSHMDAPTISRPIGGHAYNPGYPLQTAPATMPSYAPPLLQMPLPLPQSNTLAYPGTFSHPPPTAASYPAPPLSTGGFSSGPVSMNSALQPQRMNSPNPPQNFYDPTTHSATVKPDPVELSSHMTSFQHKKLTSGWNDPPPLSALAPRRTSNASAVPVGAITQPFPQFAAPAPPPFQPGNAYSATPEGSGLFSNYPGNFSQPTVGYSTAPSFHPQNFDSVSSTANETSFSAPTVTPPPPKEKEPIPAELAPLSEGFAMSLARTHQSVSASGDTHSIRKLDDVGKKLEILNDCLRSGKLSAATLSGLSNILQCIQAGDYVSALNVHANLSSQISFLEVGSFLPAIKVLVQLAQRFP